MHPFTPILAGPETGSTETLVTADISLDDIKDVKMWVDTTGHFSRPDIFRLVVDLPGLATWQLRHCAKKMTPLSANSQWQSLACAGC